jgi:hypothetical protein
VGERLQITLRPQGFSITRSPDPDQFLDSAVLKESLLAAKSVDNSSLTLVGAFMQAER